MQFSKIPGLVKYPVLDTFLPVPYLPVISESGPTRQAHDGPGKTGKIPGLLVNLGQNCQNPCLGVRQNALFDKTDRVGALDCNDRKVQQTVASKQQGSGQTGPKQSLITGLFLYRTRIPTGGFLPIY